MTAPGYLFVGMTVSDPAAIDPAKAARYGELAGKAMASAGTTIEILANGSAGSLQVHAGSYEGQTLVLERYSTLEGLQAFWNSPEYEEAKPIRRSFEGMDFHFLAAVDGTEGAPEEMVKAYTVVFSDEPSSANGGVLIDHARLEVLEGELPFSGSCTVRGHTTLEQANEVASDLSRTASFCAVLPAADPATTPG